MDDKNGTFIGVDIGGTATKVGTLGDSFSCVRFLTPKNADELNERIADAVLGMTKHPSGIGIACPGGVSDGRVRYMPNLPIGEFDGHELSKRLGAPVALINDANAAALGESIYAGFTDSVFITIGTGIGGGIVVGGRLYEGHSGYAGEIGHMIICAGGRKCGCGMNGCFEAYASATALTKRIVEEMRAHPESLMWQLCEQPERANVRVAFDAEKLGDETAIRLIDEYIEYLSIGLINICNIFRPQAIIIGGGVSNQGENLLGRLRKRCARAEYGYKFAPEPLILRAKLGCDAGMYGAIALIKKIVEENHQ